MGGLLAGDGHFAGSFEGLDCPPLCSLSEWKKMYFRQTNFDVPRARSGQPRLDGQWPSSSILMLLLLAISMLIGAQTARKVQVSDKFTCRPVEKYNRWQSTGKLISGRRYAAATILRVSLQRGTFRLRRKRHDDSLHCRCLALEAQPPTVGRVWSPTRKNGSNSARYMLRVRPNISRTLKTMTSTASSAVSTSIVFGSSRHSSLRAPGNDCC